MCAADSRARRPALFASAPPGLPRARPPQQSSAPKGSVDALLLKLLLRRAAAYVELGRMEDALGEYEEAHALAPDNGAVNDALRQLRARSRPAS